MRRERYTRGTNRFGRTFEIALAALQIFQKGGEFFLTFPSAGDRDVLERYLDIDETHRLELLGIRALSIDEEAAQEIAERSGKPITQLRTDSPPAPDNKRSR